MSIVKEQISFYKKYRTIIHNGTFYRLLSPFDDDNQTAWMVVSHDKKIAIVAHYKTLNEVNAPYRRLKLRGLDSDRFYNVGQNNLRSGTELMRAGTSLFRCI